MPLLAGLLSGFNREVDKVREERARKAEKEDGLTLGVLSTLLKSDNPDLQVRALQGMSDLAAGRPHKKGLAGYFGETDPPGVLGQVLSAIRPAAPGTTPPVTPTMGSASPTAPPPDLSDQADGPPRAAAGMQPDVPGGTVYGMPAAGAPPPDPFGLPEASPQVPIQGIFDPEARALNAEIRQRDARWKHFSQIAGRLYSDRGKATDWLSRAMLGREGGSLPVERTRNLDPVEITFDDGSTATGEFDNTAPRGEAAYYINGAPIPPGKRIKSVTLLAANRAPGGSLTSTMRVRDAQAYYGDLVGAELDGMKPDALVKIQQLPDGTMRIMPTDRPPAYGPPSTPIVGPGGEVSLLDTRGGEVMPTGAQANVPSSDMQWAQQIQKQLDAERRAILANPLTRLMDEKNVNARLSAIIRAAGGNVTPEQLAEVAAGQRTKDGRPATRGSSAAPGGPPDVVPPTDGKKAAPSSLLKRMTQPRPVPQ